MVVYAFDDWMRHWSSASASSSLSSASPSSLILACRVSFPILPGAAFAWLASVLLGTSRSVRGRWASAECPAAKSS